MSVADMDAVELADAIDDDGHHAHLRRRLEKLWEALEWAPDHYSADVKTGERLTFVTISSSEHWTRGGELGIDRFRVVFGPRGGLRTAHWRDEFSGFEVDYAETKRPSHAIRRLCEQIREAT